MATLGEKLKAANIARAEAANKAEIAKREADLAKFNADDTAVRNELTRIKTVIESAIVAGRTFKAEKFPKWEPFNTYGWPNKTMVGKFEAMNHPHFHAFQEFFDWADENGLVGKFNYEWDGGGVESWFTVTVEPK
ncbi:hypothetical protein D3C87_482820 [compost metagenome]